MQPTESSSTEFSSTEFQSNAASLPSPITANAAAGELSNSNLQVGSNLEEQATVSEATLRLLAERLRVTMHRRKVGEVIVRKAVETQIIEVPIRHEKLIVEQVSPEHKQLASIKLNTQLGYPNNLDRHNLDRREFNYRDDHQDRIALKPPSEPKPESSEFQSSQPENMAIPIALAEQILYKVDQIPRFKTAQVQLKFTDPDLQAYYESWLARRANQLDHQVSDAEDE